MKGTRIHVSSILILLLLFLPGILVLTSPNVYGKNNTTIVIALSGSTIAVGQSVTVTATLTGATATAGGTVNYNLYSNPTCTSPPSLTNTVTVSLAVVPQTTFSPGVGGTFSLNAAYSGDVNNNPSTSLCKQLIVSKTTTTITTTITVPACPPTCNIALGGTITDTAVLTGANAATASGSAVYSLYSDTTCTGPTAQTSTVTVAGGVIPMSALSPVNTPGTYTLRVAYSGDSKNLGSASACETPVTVSKAAVTITTTIVPVSPVGAGTPVHDTAALSGQTATAGGTVTYTLYSNGACGGSGQTNTVTVKNGLVPNSINFAINSIGSYSFGAVYTGDANNAGATATCEPLTVILSTPTISTTITPPTTITAAQTVTDTAVFSTPVTSNAGGTVTYTIYTNVGCSTTPFTSVAETVTVTNGNIPSATLTIITGGNNFGTYYVQATYSGDANNGPATSTCEGPITVNVASPTLSTQLSATQIFTDGGITDIATLTGASSNAGGSVAYKLYSGNACSGPAVDSDTETVTNGIVATSKSFTNHGVGTFSFQAFYSGDFNNNMATSPCNEIFTVVKHSPTISTQLSASVIPPSGTVTDTATLTGASANAGGTVTFTMYSGSLCSGGSVGTATETVTNGVVPTTGAFGAPGTGVFSFQAAYTGDGNNNPATSACNEILTVQKFSPTLSTALSASTIVVFGSVTDTATLTGATSTAGGSVTFTMYSGSSCSGGSVGTATETVTNGFVPTTGSFSANTVGFYSFEAVYTGDSNNNGVSSPCELLTVNPASPTLSILLSSNMILHGGSVTVSSGLTGATTTAGGSVKITMYTGGACSGTVEGTATETVTNAIVPTSGPFVAPTAGTYSFQAVYSGDANNMAATSSCVILTAT